MAKAKPILISLGEGENIPLNQLRLSPENVRKIYDKSAIADMAKDIRVNGLIQSLSVRKLDEPDGDITHEVQGGGRRFRALELLVKEKALAANSAIPCVPNDRNAAAQISLAENVTREQLHPLDEFRAFAALKQAGKSDEDIAADNRCSVSLVKQRLRLAAASPVLLKAFQDEKITLATLMAFCVTDNHQRQEQVWKQVKGNSYTNTSSIKQMLMEQTVPATDKRAIFVGLEAYRKAGGIIDQDLFDEANEGYLRNVELLNELVEAKLHREADKLKAKGWKWAMTGVSVPYGDYSDYDQLAAENEDLTHEEEQQLEALQTERAELIHIPAGERSKKQQKRFEQIASEIDAIENREPTFAAEDMARAGVIVEIDFHGNLSVEYGYVKPEDHDQHPDVDDETATGATGAGVDSETDEESGAKLPDSLVTDLTIQRTVCLQAALMENPAVAFLATLHAMTLSALYMWGSKSCLQITASTGFPNNLEGIKDFGPMKAMIDQRKAWTARLPKDSKDLWSVLEAMPRVEQMQLLAFLAASTVNVVVQKHDTRSGQVTHSHVLAAALTYDIRKDWAPTADNFFNRVPKSTIMASVAEARDEHTAELISHMKKAGMAVEAQRLVEGTGWIPAPLRPDVLATTSDETVDDREDDPASLPDFLQADAPSPDVAANA